MSVMNGKASSVENSDNKRLSRNNVDLEKILLCPTCREGHIKYDNNRALCLSCNTPFRFIGNIPIMLDSAFSKLLLKGIAGVESWEAYDSDYVGCKVAEYSAMEKSFWQRITPYYRVQIGPRYMDFIESYGIKGTIMELGGGPNSLDIPGVVNLDINNYNSVDVIGDARRIPFQNDSYDAIISNSVLEHIWETDLVAEECFRVVKPGGFVFINVPQVCGRHHTYDYHRWTMPGLIKLFEKFDVIEKGTILGPGMFINQLATNIARSMSSITLLKNLLSVVIEWLVFPIRFLDFIGQKRQEKENYAHTIYIIAKKRTNFISSDQLSKVHN